MKIPSGIANNKNVSQPLNKTRDSVSLISKLSIIIATGRTFSTFDWLMAIEQVLGYFHAFQES